MKELQNKLQPIVEIIRRYGITIAVVIVGGVYGYLIYTSSTLVQTEPSEAQISEKYQSAKRPKIDEAIISKLTELQDNNITFQALVDNARNNPFVE